MLAKSSLGTEAGWYTLSSLSHAMGGGRDKASTHLVTPYFPFFGKTLSHVYSTAVGKN